MPPRRGAEIVEEEEEARPGGLVFNSALSWRAGKPIATADLLKRLDELSTELREADDDIDQESLRKVAKDLAGKHLLGHKDKGVRAFTGCCLVDILKLCAPDAPYGPTELKVGDFKW
jgi:sister chromatid cohesion protein PDS5